MRVFFDNVNFYSNSGPNSFAKKLAKEITGPDCQIVNEKPDVQLAFIQATNNFEVPIVQRLDGIYFNIEQDWKRMNAPIEETYRSSRAVIFQSEFNKNLIEKYFGKHSNSNVIRNGTNLTAISKIQPILNDTLSKFDQVWSCASSWRPHKRLKENIRYFLEFSNPNDCLVIAGENPDYFEKNDRIFYVGNIEWKDLISLYKKSSMFLHLAWLDHCPNVVVDARACGCHIVCSSAGGTKEIAGLNSTIINEETWDFEPIHLYKPPDMNFFNSETGKEDYSIDIKDVAKEYKSVLLEAIG